MTDQFKLALEHFPQKARYSVCAGFTAVPATTPHPSRPRNSVSRRKDVSDKSVHCAAIQFDVDAGVQPITALDFIETVPVRVARKLFAQNLLLALYISAASRHEVLDITFGAKESVQSNNSSHSWYYFLWLVVCNAKNCSQCQMLQLQEQTRQQHPNQRRLNPAWQATAELLDKRAMPNPVMQAPCPIPTLILRALSSPAPNRLLHQLSRPRNSTT